MQRSTRDAVIMLVLCLAALASGCQSESAKQPEAAMSPEARDAGVIAALEASERWQQPLCRPLQSGGYVPIASEMEPLYRTAYHAGLIELEQFGDLEQYPPDRMRFESFSLRKANPKRRSAGVSPAATGDFPSRDVSLYLPPTRANRPRARSLSSTQSISDGNLPS